MSSISPAEQQVSGPATGLMVTAIIGFAFQALGILGNLFGFTMGMAVDGPESALNFLSGTIGILFNLVAIGIGVVVLLGAQKMKRLESHNWAMASSILAMVPCISPCCVVGLPIGIWALVVLSKPEVKSAFR